MPPPSHRSAMISVDLSTVADDVLDKLPTRADQERYVMGVGAAAMAEWKRLAQQGLHGTRKEYLQGLVQGGDGRRFTITLEGTLPNLIEQGMRGGDMRQWMLSGPKVKSGKNGKYLVIPFAHGSPGSTNAGPAMPSSIYRAAKKLGPTLSRPRTPGGGRTTPKKKAADTRLSVNSEHLSRQARHLLTVKQKPWHASSVYKHMTRSSKTYQKATQTGGYTTFRTISENVIRGEKDDDGKPLQHWVHPGLHAKDYAKKTQRLIRRIATPLLVDATRNR